MGESTCRLSFKVSTFVGKCQLIFLSLVGNSFLVLSVVSIIFSPFVASRLTPFTSSSKSALEMVDLCQFSLSLVRLFQCKNTR